MSPLTHAVVGMAISQRVRSTRLGRLGWPLALVLAFVSHFLLDSIPHIDAFGPLRAFRFGGVFFPLFGLIGIGLATYLFMRNSDAALIWILLSAWLVIAAFSGNMFCGLAASALIAWLAYRTRQVDAPAYLLAAILAIAPDILQRSLAWMMRIHDSAHYEVGWGTALALRFQTPPLPSGSLARLQNPYFQSGLILEMMVEAGIFLLAFLSFSRLTLEKEEPPAPVDGARQMEETRVPA